MNRRSPKMPTPPPPPDPRHRKAARVVVLLGDTAGNVPTITDRCDFLIATNLTRDFGGGTLDSITFRFDLARYGSRLQDTSLPTGHNRIVEVRIENPTNGKLDQVLGWGKLARQPQQIGDNESVGFVARLDPFLFGSRLNGYPVRDPQSDTIVTVKKPLIFNPVIDDVRLPNCSDFVDEHGARLVLEPESIRTAAARQLHNSIASRWDLATAVERICWTLNPDEEWISNPSLASLNSVLGTETPLLENHKIALDVTLPEALDQLLAPHGFTWFVEHSIDTSDPTLPRTSTITVAERGHGPETTLRLQRLQDTLDSSKTTIDSLTIAYDIAARPNVIVGRSGLAIREGTFPLRPAWPKSSDKLSKAELTEEYKEHDREHIDVYRKFVFDTAGDYTGLRDDFNDGVAALNDLFGTPTVPMRRRFKPALTQGLDRQPIGVNGYLVEWHNGTQWVTVPWSFSVLEHEAGIVLERGIDEDFRAEFLKKSRSVPAGDPPSPILRITCSLQGDVGETFTAERRAESANGSDIPRHYDLSHKFHDTKVLDSTSLASVLYPDRHTPITGVSVIGGSGGKLTVSPDLSSVLVEGDRLAILGSTGNDGVYHVASVVFVSGVTSITLREPILDPTPDGTLSYLANEEAPLTQLKAYCEHIQSEEDFVVIHADAQLFGIDHPEYRLGQVVTKVEQRNLSLDSYAAAAVTQRHPQITRLTYQLDGQQKLSLVLDQFDKVSDAKQQRQRTK